jgi:hypothetical protein
MGTKSGLSQLREVLELEVFENRMLRSVFEPMREEVTGYWRNYIMRSSMLCTHHQTLLE